MKMKTTGSCFAIIRLKAQIFISTRQFDFSPWLLRYIFRSVVNSLKLMANICSGQQQIDIILTWIARVITKVHKKAIKCLGTSIFFCADILFA